MIQDVLELKRQPCYELRVGDNPAYPPLTLAPDVSTTDAIERIGAWAFPPQLPIRRETYTLAKQVGSGLVPIADSVDLSSYRVRIKVRCFC